MGNSSNLIESTLAEVCSLVTDGTHDTPNVSESGYPLVKAKEIVGGIIDFDDCVKVSEEEHKKIISRSKPEFGDTLFAHIGASLGEAAYINTYREFSIKNVALFKPDPKKIDSRYLNYIVKSPQFQELAKRNRTGSAQPFLSLGHLRSHKIQYHEDLETQQKIASILSAFDDLIENNTRRIAILEEMARLIYREWFVLYRYPAHENDRFVDSGTELGDVPEGWEVKTLEGVADLNPENISNDFKGEIEYINISGVDTGKISDTENYNIDDAPGRAKRKVNHGDIIWSSVRPNLKSYALIMNPKTNWIASTGFAVIRPLKLPPSLLYNFVTTDYFVEYLINHARGSAYPAVNVSDFKNAKIVVPPDDFVNRYDDLVWSNFQQIDRLERKNKKLKETRDLLLPKLISGIIKV